MQNGKTITELVSQSYQGWKMVATEFNNGDEPEFELDSNLHEIICENPDDERGITYVNAIESLVLSLVANGAINGQNKRLFEDAIDNTNEDVITG